VRGFSRCAFETTISEEVVLCQFDVLHRVKSALEKGDMLLFDTERGCSGWLDLVVDRSYGLPEGGIYERSKLDRLIEVHPENVNDARI
jgi:hypothetical protein